MAQLRQSSQHRQRKLTMSHRTGVLPGGEEKGQGVPLHQACYESHIPCKKKPQKNPGKGHGSAQTLSTVPAVCPAPNTWFCISLGTWRPQLCQPRVEAEAGVSLPAQHCQSPSGCQGAAQSTPGAKGNRTNCHSKLLGPSCPKTHHPLSPLSLLLLGHLSRRRS